MLSLTQKGRSPPALHLSLSLSRYCICLMTSILVMISAVGSGPKKSDQMDVDEGDADLSDVGSNSSLYVSVILSELHTIDPLR